MAPDCISFGWKVLKILVNGILNVVNVSGPRSVCFCKGCLQLLVEQVDCGFGLLVEFI